MSDEFLREERAYLVRAEPVVPLSNAPKCGCGRDVLYECGNCHRHCYCGRPWMKPE